MGVYEEFQERKERGEKLDINALTREELKAMWYDEVHFDKDIAKLFEVTENRVKTLRNRMELSLDAIKFDERVKFIQILGDASTDIAAAMESLPTRDKDQFEKFIHELSDWFKKNKSKSDNT